MVNKPSISKSNSILKVSMVVASVLPKVLAFAFCLPIFILSNITISICKYFLSISFLHKINKFSIIHAVFVLKLSFSFLSIIFPLSFIIVSFWGSPNSETIFHPIFPISFEYFSIIPMIGTIPFPLSIHKPPSIDTINISFRTLNWNILIILSLKNFFLCNM